MYHLFSGQWYYPNSGLGDYVAAYKELDEAQSHAHVLIEGAEDWFSIVTERNGRLVEVDNGWRK